MKCKSIEKLTPKKPRKKGKVIKISYVKDIAVIHAFINKVLYATYAMNIETHEYASFRYGIWSKRGLYMTLGYSYRYCSKDDWFIDKTESEELVKALDNKGKHYTKNPLALIDSLESDYNWNKRTTREHNRKQKVMDFMAKTPELPDNIGDWIDEMAAGGEVMLQDCDSKLWNCSYCGGHSEYEFIEREDGQKHIRHNDKVICPLCGASLVLKKHKIQTYDVKTACAICQNVDDDTAMVRHFDVLIHCNTQEKKAVWLSESTRVVFYRRKDIFTKFRGCDIYFNQYPCNSSRQYYTYYGAGFITAVDMDNKSNPSMRRMTTEYMYPSGDIQQVLKGTPYEAWGRTFEGASAAGIPLNFNNLMACNMNTLPGIAELILKGRFRTLLSEMSEDIYTWDGGYHGVLKANGDSIETVFGISDRQLINRIRDRDGGTDMVEWLRWSERHKIKVSDKALNWFMDNKVSFKHTQWILTRMSPEAAANYVERQMKESYKGKTAQAVLSQYGDYMDMCKKLGKNISDELTYKPRELKRRHDEAIHELELRKAEIKADEMRQRFPGAEEILHEMTAKLSWEDDMYLIRVPQELVEIVKEGNMLHHCAGSSDRYFDRIMNRETFICFLRRKEAPDEPYYTIEVEPGGTIRQHRGAYDEEPDIENIKPHLRDWQKVIKKRMTKKDKKYAAKSKELREANIEDLKAKNNTRVLQGLMEDFMEAM